MLLEVLKKQAIAKDLVWRRPSNTDASLMDEDPAGLQRGRIEAGPAHDDVIEGEAKKERPRDRFRRIGRLSLLATYVVTTLIAMIAWLWLLVSAVLWIVELANSWLG
jgi:hypothetical protein